jgi:hypothetical protein
LARGHWRPTAHLVRVVPCAGDSSHRPPFAAHLVQPKRPCQHPPLAAGRRIKSDGPAPLSLDQKRQHRSGEKTLAAFAPAPSLCLALSLYRRRERVSSVAAGHSPPAVCQRWRHGVEQSQPPELLPLLPFHLLPLGHLRRRHRRLPAERPTSREEQRLLGKRPLPPKGILSFRRWRRRVPAPPMFFFPVPPLDAHKNRAERCGLAAAHLCRRRR